jgi:DNA-binding response OmpR family regulator
VSTLTSTHTRILVIDDDPSIRLILTRYLGLEGYEVITAGTVDEARIALDTQSPDLVLLDVILGLDDGLDLLETVRSRSQLPVILLTGNAEEADRVTGLKLGADDYVVKPFSCVEVEARIANVLRRSRPADLAPVISYDNLTIDLGTREVIIDGETLTLTAMEFDLLSFLAASPRQVFSREQLLDRVWKSNAAWQSTDTVTEHVRRLRKRVETDPNNPRWISTVRGRGYSFTPAA